MPYYDDLSTYIVDLPMRNVAALHVGWLGRGHDFPVGDVPTGFAIRLARLAILHRENPMRGWQECVFCEDEYPIHVELDGRREPVGDGEIHVPGPDGRVFAAPTLIVHYVVRHKYRPPNVFIEAVMTDERA